jgi:hypothetical protein
MTSSPGDSSRPANSEPIITQSAPAAMALAMSPDRRMPPSAITGTFLPVVRSARHRVHDGGDLRHAHAGHDARRADRARADADLDRVRPARMRSMAASAVAMLPAMTWMLCTTLDRPDRADHVLRVAVGGVDHDHIDLGGEQRLDPIVLVNADRRAAPQAAAAVAARAGEAAEALDVPHGDQAGEVEGLVDEQELLDLVLVEEPLGFGERGAGGAVMSPRWS